MTQTVVPIPESEGGGSFDPTDIEITDGVDDAFLIKDTSGDEWFKIDTRPGTTGNGQFAIVMAPTSGQRVLIGGQNGSSSGPFSPLQVLNQNADSFAMRVYGDHPYASSTDNQFVWGRDNVVSRWIHPLGGRFDCKSSSGSFTFRDSSDSNMFVLDDDTSATFTLDYNSGATFKVVDDNASPRTFIQITEGSNTRCLIPTLSFNEVKNASAGRVMQLTTSNGIAIESTPLNHIGSDSLTYDQSNDGTSIDIGKTPSFTVVYSSAASAAATSGITLQVTGTDFQDGCVAPQYLVLQNQNSTHSAKFILDPIGDFAAKETATTGTDAADLIGSGFTLAAGKMAVFTLLACRVRDTGSHYFYCVSLHTKT